MDSKVKLESPQTGASRAWGWATPASRVLFAVGILLSTSFLATGGRVHWPLILTTLSTAAHVVVWRPPRAMPRALKVAAWAWLGALGGILGYATLTFSLVLWWAIHPALAAGAIVAMVLAVATAIRPWWGVRVSPSLGSGLCILGSLLAWPLEESRVRCDDFAAATGQADVTIVKPSSDLAAACAEGGEVPIGRFPRKVWEPASGERIFVTTQPVGPSQPRDVFDGSACNTSLESGEVSCVLSGVGYGFAPAPDRERIYLANHDSVAEIVALNENTLAIEARAEVHKAVHAWYDPEASEVGVFTDQRGAFVHDADDLTRLAEYPTAAQPDRLYYDRGRDEGLLCFASGPAKSEGERGIMGRGFMALAFETSPFRDRGLGSPWLSRLSFSWGCGWDPTRRRVYAGVTTLGLLAEIDYDTGEVVGYTWVGPGTRPIEVDSERGLIYVGYFFDGRVVALRMDGSVAHRWFVGRFVRDIQRTRDGQRLWVTSNLGLVEIDLPPMTPKIRPRRRVIHSRQ